MRQAYNVGNMIGAGTAFGLASRDFDGSDYVSIPSLEAVVQSDFSICLWHKLDDGQPPSTNIAIGVRDAATNNFFSIDCRNDRKLDFLYETNGTQSRITTGFVYSNGAETWHHVAMTMDADGNLTGYSDGLVSGTPVPTGTPADFSNGLAAYIGGRNYNGTLEFPFAGLIADVRVYSRIISASEVADLAAGTDISSASLEGWWLLNDDDVLDYSGNGNNGINNGSTYSTDGPLA